jgi:hypothetical protein
MVSLGKAVISRYSAPQLEQAHLQGANVDVAAHVRSSLTLHHIRIHCAVAYAWLLNSDPVNLQPTHVLKLALGYGSIASIHVTHRLSN